MTAVVMCALEEGEEVLFSYGSKSSADMLCSYGFCPLENVDEQASVLISISLIGKAGADCSKHNSNSNGGSNCIADVASMSVPTVPDSVAGGAIELFMQAAEGLPSPVGSGLTYAYNDGNDDVAAGT
jgi:hypothetical protein